MLVKTHNILLRITTMNEPVTMKSEEIHWALKHFERQENHDKIAFYFYGYKPAEISNMREAFLLMFGDFNLFSLYWYCGVDPI